jgi:3D (Asp-Asp-Asp) domain-containing protein
MVLLAQTRVGRVLEIALYGTTVLLLVLVVGVQIGIARGRWLQAREDRRPIPPASFVDTSCGDELGRIRLRVVATGYSSTPDQTDSSPFITATGTRVRAGVIALSPDLRRLLPYGSEILVVEDSTHPRLRQTMDVWFPSREAALRWGRRTLTVELER